MKTVCLIAATLLCTACFHGFRAQQLDWKTSANGKSSVLAERKLLDSVQSVDIRGPVALYLTVGANKNRLIAKGVDLPSKHLSLRQKNGVLSLRSGEKVIVLDIALQRLSQLKLNGLRSVTIISKNPLMRLSASLQNILRCVFNVNAILLDIEAKGHSKITVYGNTTKFVAHLYQTSQLDAANLRAYDVKIKTYNDASAEVYPISCLFAAAMGRSRIIYLRQPHYIFIFPYATGNVLYIPRTVTI